MHHITVYLPWKCAGRPKADATTAKSTKNACKIQTGKLLVTFHVCIKISLYYNFCVIHFQTYKNGFHFNFVLVFILLKIKIVVLVETVYDRSSRSTDVLCHPGDCFYIVKLSTQCNPILIRFCMHVPVQAKVNRPVNDVQNNATKAQKTHCILEFTLGNCIIVMSTQLNTNQLV